MKVTSAVVGVCCTASHVVSSIIRCASYTYILFALWFIHSSNHPFTRASFVCSSIPLLIGLFVHPIIRSLVGSFVRSPIPLLIGLFIHPIIRSLVSYSFVRQCLCSSVYLPFLNVLLRSYFTLTVCILFLQPRLPMARLTVTHQAHPGPLTSLCQPRPRVAPSNKADSSNHSV